ncbi:hypothetical protein [Bathymodiolus platifrons methanotrophic gill symbiont]|nr:hypothetical protein [Bathymodiolus platifrons methanotrophic gill symbiont]
MLDMLRAETVTGFIESDFCLGQFVETGAILTRKYFSNTALAKISR